MEIAEELGSTGTEFLIFSGLTAFFHPQNQTSVNVATNMSFCFTVRKADSVNGSSADQATVKSGTGLPFQKLSFRSTHFWPALINLPKLCLLRFACRTVLQPPCCPANTFSVFLWYLGLEISNGTNCLCLCNKA